MSNITFFQNWSSNNHEIKKHAQKSCKYKESTLIKSISQLFAKKKSLCVFSFDHLNLDVCDSKWWIYYPNPCTHQNRKWNREPVLRWPDSVSFMDFFDRRLKRKLSLYRKVFVNTRQQKKRPSKQFCWCFCLTANGEFGDCFINGLFFL